MEANPIVACRCGCGATFPKYDASRRPRSYVLGHNGTPAAPLPPARPIPVIIATSREDLVFQAERAAARYLSLNATGPRTRLVVIVRELDPGELDRG